MSVSVLGVPCLSDVETFPFIQIKHHNMTSTTTLQDHHQHIVLTQHHASLCVSSELEYDFNFNPEKQKSDRFFNPWRVPSSKASSLLAEDVINQISSYELEHGIRGRARQRRHSVNHDLAVTSIVCDMLHYVFSGETDGVAISRSNRINTAKSRYRPEFIGKTLPDILDVLASGQLSIIRQEIGYESWDSSRHQMTKIYPGEGLVALMDRFNIKPSEIRCKPQRECIVLKSTKNGYWDDSVPVEYQDTDTIHVYRNQVHMINEWIGSGEITYHPIEGRTGLRVDLSDRYLRRIFTRERFDSGGRLFGGFWQNLEKRCRKGLMIDGEPAWEIDYRQVAPRILYSIAGVKPEQNDLYAMPQFAGHSCERNYREGFKRLLNALLFVDGSIKKKPKGTARTLPPKISVHELVDMLRDNHPDISSYFGTGIGHHLQFLESQILIDVIMRLMDRGIVALPLHDAILIPKSRVSEAIAIMRITFLSHTGLHIDLSIKEAGCE